MLMVISSCFYQQFLHCHKYETWLPITLPKHGFPLIQKQISYYIQTVLDSEYVLAAPADPNGGTVTLSPKAANVNPNQLWSIQGNSNGTITIISQGNQAYAMDAGEPAQDGNPVILKPFEENKPSQQWKREGLYLMPSSNNPNGLAMAVSIGGATSLSGAEIILLMKNEVDYQKFEFVVWGVWCARIDVAGLVGCGGMGYGLGSLTWWRI